MARTSSPLQNKSCTSQQNICVGYIGSSTRSEIEYAKANGREVRYLEPMEEYELPQ